MASLFGRNRLVEAASEVNTSDLQSELSLVHKWHHDYHKGSLRTDNETSREQQFNQDFFVTILGYQMKPFAPYTLEPKASSFSGKIPDARLGIFDLSSGIDETSAVVELKGASVQLDKPQKGKDNDSPVAQGFKYRPLYRGAEFVVVSNFYETRLYNDTQLDYDVWTLDDLVDPKDDYLAFRTFYLLLHSRNLLRHGGVSKTEQLLSDIRVTQQKIGQKFYEDYRQARAALLANLFENNSSVAADLEFGIEKAQKIIDRVVFACFAEDRGLLPDNTLERIIRQQQSMPWSMWASLKTFFNAIDRGDDKLEIPVGYNGGLFAPDTDLDALKIDDKVISQLLSLGANYNFEKDLSVTILGHIFEQSITDLEQIRRDVDSAEVVTLEVLIGGRRRNDGVYYTPEYIVRHMVDQAVGGYLREQEQRILKEQGLHSGINDDTYARREKLAYAIYRDSVLIPIRVLDAACGSGAFLTAAYDYLIAEHNRVSTILGNDIYSNELLTGMILRSNLFGVDINEESVEITKLSLWLKSAKKNTKLEGLDANIRVGNSLVRLQEGFDGKAFNWHDEFPNVFSGPSSGSGFDSIVMNPPYIKEFTNRSAFDGIRGTPVYQGKMDLWYAFGSLALDLVKQETGRIAFIAPANWITNAGASRFRTRVAEEARFIAFWDFGDSMIFDDASIQTMIYVMRRSDNNDDYTFPYARIDGRKKRDQIQRFLAGDEIEDSTKYSTRFQKPAIAGNAFAFNDATITAILDQIRAASLTTLYSEEISTGIDVHQDYLSAKNAHLVTTAVPGDGIFNLSNKEYSSLNFNALEKDLVRPFYTSSQLGRFWGCNRNDAWVIYTDSSYKTPGAMANMPSLREHLDKFAPVITSDNAPYGLHRARNPKFFSGPSIVSIRKASRPTFTYVDFDCYVSQTYNVISTDRFDLRAITALLNSSLVAFWLRFKGKMQGAMYQVDKDPLLQIPLIFDSRTEPLKELTEVSLVGRNQLSEIDRTFSALMDSLAPGWSDTNRKWWTYEIAELLGTVDQHIAIGNHDSLVNAFVQKRDLATAAVQAVDDAERLIDDLVFSVYALTSDQIDLVRSSIAAADVTLP